MSDYLQQGIFGTCIDSRAALQKRFEEVAEKLALAIKKYHPRGRTGSVLDAMATERIAWSDEMLSLKAQLDRTK